MQGSLNSASRVADVQIATLTSMNGPDLQDWTTRQYAIRTCMYGHRDVAEQHTLYNDASLVTHAWAYLLLALVVAAQQECGPHT